MKNLPLYIVAIVLGQVLDAQTLPQNITKPESGQTTYHIDSNSGTTHLLAKDFILLKNGTWIKSGADFLAQVNDDLYEPPVVGGGGTGGNGENYIYTRTYQKGMQSASGIASNRDVIEQITYFDGLGRPLQNIAIKASPDKKDIITHIGYDSYGRMKKEWLPFEETTGDLGSLRTGAEGKTDDYYEVNYASDIDPVLPNPFSEKAYETSPLNRVLRQAAPGKNWKLNGGHEIHFEYQANNATDVLRFDVTFLNGDTENPQLSPNGNYGAGELYRTITKDENWVSGTDHTTEEFADKQGRVLLKRTYNGTAHNTFYVYDDFGNLTFVIPPKVTATNVSQLELDELCYQYRYDHRNRLIEKKIPGKDWEYIVYNKLDQPIMTQDPNLKAQGKWHFTKYDAFGRVVVSGLIAETGNRPQVQSAADNYTGNLWTERNPNIPDPFSYYNGSCYPQHVPADVNIQNYYDDHDFVLVGGIENSSFGVPWSDKNEGLPTGSLVRILDDPNQYLLSYIFYDDKGRTIFECSGYTDPDNDINYQNLSEIELDFTGKTTKVESTHKRIDGVQKDSIITLDTFEYDHVARLIKQEQELAGNTEMLAHNSYDGLGQLVQKKIGNTENAPLQEVDYKYNIRGWLTQINDIADTTPDKLFNFKIGYTDGTTPLYNGNISNTQWRTDNLDSNLRTYQYGYDALNRITAATATGGSFGLGLVEYDKNGNITKLKRNGTGGLIDDLTYNYHDSETSNRLQRVADASGSTDGFANGSNTTTEYTYDPNGNMLTDANKNIIGIDYNYMNLPTTITQANAGSNNTLTYLYGADGTKLKKTTVDYSNGSGGTPKVTEYSGNYVYENGDLKQFYTAEGYAEPKDASDYSAGFQYVYQYRDIWRNTRLTYADDNGNGTIETGGSYSEIRREQNYYPFGLEHKGYNNISYGAKNNLKTYQGQEFTEDLGLNTHEWKYRVSDPAIGRFWQVDPLAEDYTYNSTYAFQENKLGMGVELEGLEAVEFDDLFSDEFTAEEAEQGALGQMGIAFTAMMAEMGSNLDNLFVNISGIFKKDVVDKNGTGTALSTTASIEGGPNVEEALTNYTINQNGEAEWNSSLLTFDAGIKTELTNTATLTAKVTPVADLTVKTKSSTNVQTGETTFSGQATFGVKNNGLSVKASQNVNTGSSKVDAGLSGSIKTPKVGGFSLGLNGFLGIRWTSEED